MRDEEVEIVVARFCERCWGDRDFQSRFGELNSAFQKSVNVSKALVRPVLERALPEGLVAFLASRPMPAPAAGDPACYAFATATRAAYDSALDVPLRRDLATALGIDPPPTAADEDASRLSKREVARFASSSNFVGTVTGQFWRKEVEVAIQLPEPPDLCMPWSNSEIQDPRFWKYMDDELSDWADIYHENEFFRNAINQIWNGLRQHPRDFDSVLREFLVLMQWNKTRSPRHWQDHPTRPSMQAGEVDISCAVRHFWRFIWDHFDDDLQFAIDTCASLCETDYFRGDEWVRLHDIGLALCCAYQRAIKAAWAPSTDRADSIEQFVSRVETLVSRFGHYSDDCTGDCALELAYLCDPEPTLSCLRAVRDLELQKWRGFWQHMIKSCAPAQRYTWKRELAQGVADLMPQESMLSALPAPDDE